MHGIPNSGGLKKSSCLKYSDHIFCMFSLNFEKFSGRSFFQISFLASPLSRFWLIFIVMVLEPAVVDISSDEEGGWYGCIDATIDWISELFDFGENKTEESDDVVVVEELSCASASQKQNNTASNALKGASRDDSDDECLVLDGDPDKPVTVTEGAEDGSDDLLIVGEKGQIACRDYPHPRHLCATFPFSTTPHEKHCHLCHCYVCDVPAPCNYWGNGISYADHCHSSDKEEAWNVRRKCFRQGNTAALPIQKPPDTTLTMTPSCQNPEPQFRACSSNFGPPNIISHRHSHSSRLVNGKYRFAPYRPAPQPLIPRSHPINKERSGGGGTCGPQHASTRLRSARSAYPGGAHTTVARSGYPLDRNSMFSATQPRIRTTQVIQGHDFPKQTWQEFLELSALDNTSLASSQVNSSSNPVDLQTHNIPLLPQSHGQSIPQVNSDANTHHSGVPALGGTDPNPPDVDNGWASQRTVEVDNTFPRMQTSNPPAALRADHEQPENVSGSSGCHLESWMYSLEHQAASENPLGYDPSHNSTVDPALLLYEYEQYMGHLARVI